VVDQILNRYGVGIAWEPFEKLRKMIRKAELVVDDEIENCNRGKLL
jgi:hypothetical protein